MSNQKILLSPPHMGTSELEHLTAAFQSNWIAPLGPYVDAFEQAMCRYLQIEHAAALSSGTAAIHLALNILNVGYGDIVLCSDLTFAATANPIRYVGATPIFIDCEPATWNIDADLLEEEIVRLVAAGRPPKAVIVVHLFGQAAQIERIMDICNRHSVPVIEDAAESLGTMINGRHTGTFGTLAALSFNGNKIITTSGGGMLLGRQAAPIARARHLATQAREPAEHYEHRDIGYNYRMSNLLAAVGVGQLSTLEDKVAARRRHFTFYKERLGLIKGITFQNEIPGSRSNRWLSCILIDPALTGFSRQDVARQARALDIETRPVWKPMHQQPIYADCRFVGPGHSEQIFAKGLCLPSGSALTPADLERVVGVFESVRTHA